MKKQAMKKCKIKLKERDVVVKNKEREGAISNKKCEGIIKSNDYGITLIALAITVIVLLILARHFYKYAQPVTTAF